jgi:pimeloyl-ACP methyl ester carboxylesterase
VKPIVGTARWIWTLTLATLLVFAVFGILLWGYALVGLGAWERFELQEGVQEGDWLWIDGKAIYYDVWGPATAPTVVLVHGHAVEGSAIWQATAQELSGAGLRVIAFDMRGFGRSDRDLTPDYSLRSQADTLAKALNELFVSDAILVGHGWGSGVVLQLAAEQPQFAGRLVLLAPMLDDGVPPLWRQVVKVPHLGPAAAWAVSSGGPVWRASQVEAFGDPEAIPRGYWERVRPSTRVQGTAETLRMMALSPADDDLPEALPTIDVPVLVLLGDEDRRVSQESVEELAAQLRDVRVVMVTGAGHSLQIEQAGEVNARIADFALRGVR